MWPPGRASAAASSNVAGTPTASTDTSAPSPPVSSRTTASGVLAAVVDDDVGAELLGGVEPAVGEIDRHDVARAVQPGAHDHRQPDRAGTDHGDDITGLDVAVEHADLVAGRQDVGQHQQLLVADPVGLQVGRRVGERHPHVLGLGAVDLVAEDPAATAEALAVTALAGSSGTPRTP